MRTRRTALLVLFAVFGTLLAPTSIDEAFADGTPDLLLGKTMPQVALLGAEIPVIITVSNPSGPNGYNASFTETLPAGVSYVGGSANPEPVVLPQGDGTTVLVWTNLADAITGATVEVQFSIVTGAGFDPGDSVITSSGVYAHNNPRTVPDIDPVTGVATGDFSGFDTASRSTRMLAFTLTKTEPSAEGEVLRGVHDHQTVYTLTIDNNLVQSSSGFSIIDYLPAGLDYLGCGGVDNSSADEYPGSGAINPGNEPALVNTCITPTSITTVNLDPDGLGIQESGVHTRLTWNAATLATSLPAGGSFSMDYLAAIPLQENSQTSVGDLTANIDNNTGALTTETEDELESYAVASGIYGGDSSSSTDTDYHEVIAEDLSIHKTVDNATFVQGDTPTFTLELETSEYALSTGPITVTDVLPPALDFTGATPSADSAVVQGDGSTLITWTLPALSAPSVATNITVNTLVRTTYRNGDGSDGSPVASNDQHTNTTSASSDVTVLSDNTGSTATVALVDESSAIQSAEGPSIVKEVSEPVGGTLTCGDGTGVTFVSTTASSYRPGDRVCFRLSADFPAALDTIAPVVTDLLPAGFTLESWVMGATSDIDSSGITFTDNTSHLEWELADKDVGAIHVELVLSTIIDTPDAAADADLIENLMKLRYSNTQGEVFQLRDQAVAAWAEPQLALDKGVTLVNGVAVPAAPADDVNVEEGDLVTFQLNISNSGGVSALDATVRDELPTQITCADVSSISTAGTCDGANNWISWDVSSDIDILGGTSSLLTYVVAVPVGTSAGASLTNRAGVRTYEGETNTGTTFTFIPSDNIDSTLTTNTAPADDTSQVVTSLPTLDKTATTSITETGNDATAQATIGETISYTVDVDLPDAITYYNASFTDTLDLDSDLIESSVVVTLDGAALPVGFTVTADDATNTLTVDFPTPYAIPDGTDEQLRITFDSLITDTTTNVRGHVSSNRADLDFEDVASTTRNVTDAVDVDVVEPNIMISKNNDDADGKVVASQVVTYTLDVSNPATGNVSVAHDTIVVDTIPEELVLLESPGDPAEDGDTIAPDGGVWNESSRTITWSLGSIDPAAATSLTYAIQIGNPLVAAGTLTNTATATTSSITGTPTVERTSSSPNGNSEGDGYLDEAESSVVVPVLDITKAVSSLTATVGDALTYTLDIELPEAVIAYDVTTLDDLPPGLVFEAVTSVTCDQGGSACSPDITSVTSIEGGGDVAFFLDDLTSAVGDRVVTIEYLTVVDDVPQADDGSTLQNTATVHWNDTDSISGTPVTPPAAASFSDSSGPWSIVVNTDEPTLAIDKDVVGQVADTDAFRAKPGDTLSYVITVQNTGTSPAYSATVSDLATDDSWTFADTTSTPGTTNTDADSNGGLEWLIDGPIAPGGTATITYDLVVSTLLTPADEVSLGPDATNTADIPSYYGVESTIRAANPGRPYRNYDDVTTDQVELELDLASIGDFVWFDTNDDGVQDVGEPGLPDVDVIVTYLGLDGSPGGGDDEVTTTATDSTGGYFAERLPGGSYTVDVDETDPDFLTGVVPSYDLDGTTISPNGSWTGPLAQDGDVNNVDFGYSGTGSIGGTVWFDQNRDDVIDTAEARIENIDVTVTWLGPDDSTGGGDDVVYLASTNASGTYLVGSLPPGEFIVEIDTASLPTGYVNVSDPGGQNDNLSQVTLGGGAANLAQDFGYAGTDLIGDLVWLDQDNDGTQNGAEPGLGGIIMALTHFGPDGVAGGTDDSSFATTTDAAGNYEFRDLPPGVFEVEVTGGVPAGTTNSYDPDTGGLGDARSSVTLIAGAANLDQDFGFNATSVLGDRVWWDLNSDGVQDLGEPGLNGVDVTATYLGPDTTLGTIDDQVFLATTSGDGDYLFTGVSDGEYMIAITGGVSAGFSASFDEDSGTTSPDETTDLTLTTAHITADFGYSGAGSLGDMIWFDHNIDGVLDPGEFGLEAVEVDMTWFGTDGVSGGGDDLILTQTTAADGSYVFAGLPAGSFSLDVIGSTLASGLISTFDADSGTSSPDGSSIVVLGVGEVVSDQDFGYAGTGSIGDTVWFDHDGDGSVDIDEVGLRNVDVDVVWAGLSGPQTFTTTTDISGIYLIENLPPGDFTVSVDSLTLPGGVVATYDVDGGFDAASATTLGAGLSDLNHDFGFRGNATIGDTIWLDLDGDGTQSVDEPGVPTQRVELQWQSPSGPVLFTTDTDPSGNYLFGGLADGDYTVTATNGIVDLAENTGDPGADGDSTNDLTIASGTSSLGQNFGYQGLNSLGDQVWIDDDQNGIFDSAEQGISTVAVEVRWYGLDGASGGGDDAVLPRAITDVLGTYLVTGLPDGNYSVAVVDGLPDGIDTPSYDHDDGTANPDARSEVLDLGVGAATAEATNDQDFGFTGSGVIGETIWLNLNGDATQDSNEPGVSDVQVTLTWAGFDATLGTADDIVRPTQLTDSTGSYLFEQLPPGLYEVSYEDDDLEPGIQPQVDADGGDLTTALVTLGPDEEDRTQNFGVAGNATLTGSVFVDSDGDGVRDPDEQPLSGVTVTVRWAGPTGPIDFTLVTGADGTWELTNMPPGEYIVLLGLATVPPELVPTIPIVTELTVAPASVVVANNGLVAGASIGDLVWHDDDRSGAVTAGELGIESVRVNLSNEDGDVVQSTESTLDGAYLFEGLTPGDYTVEIDETSFPANMEIVVTPEDDDGVDTMTTIALEPAADVDTADFGLDGPEADTAPALAFTGRTVGDLLLLAGLLLWVGMMLTEGTRPRRKPEVIKLKISSDGRTVVT